MATEDGSAILELLKALESPDWSVVLQAVALADQRMQGSIVGDPKLEEIVVKVAALASHSKWEVRRAVANAAAHAAHPVFESVLAKLTLDDNSRVGQAAKHATLRRRDSRHASALGKQHEERINSTLDGIETRFGVRGRAAVKRAAEQIANTFARELYHETINLVTPLAASAERLRAQLLAGDVPAEVLAEEADRIGWRVTQLRARLDGMRAYTAQPTLSFKEEVLIDMLQDAANLALESEGDRSPRPSIEIDVPSRIVVDVSRVRLVQALTNVMLNAIESYEGVESLNPVKVRAGLQEGLAAIRVEDFGCGMSVEAQRDALALFVTSKAKGTGFGLPLAVKIVESEHEGRLSIDSVKGRGTIIDITIPRHRQA